MSGMEKYARDAIALAGRPPTYKSTGAGEAYKGNQEYQYFAGNTQEYAKYYGHIASNVYSAECQGINSEDFYEYQPVKIRTSVAADTRTGETMPDDWQEAVIIQPSAGAVLKPGAYLKYADNIWLVYKGFNVGAVTAKAIVRRCNFVIRKLDYYGNPIEIPASFSKMGTLGNESFASDTNILARGYINCICQKNADSADFRENTRFIVGREAYAMRGVNSFTRDFTEDADSVKLYSFTMERAELLDTDNMELEIADYAAFSWDISLVGHSTMLKNSVQTLTVSSAKNGKAISSTAEHPISYLFSSSDTSVVSVTNSGSLTAHNKTGTADVSVRLTQNPEIKAVISVEVSENAAQNYVEFISGPIDTVGEYESAVIEAAYFENGAKTNIPISYTAKGAEHNSYSIEPVSGNQWKVNCYAASMTPLTITAAHGTYSATIDILLVRN